MQQGFERQCCSVLPVQGTGACRGGIQAGGHVARSSAGAAAGALALAAPL